MYSWCFLRKQTASFILVKPNDNKKALLFSQTNNRKPGFSISAI